MIFDSPDKFNCDVFGRRIDVWVFGLLFLTITLYQLQLAVPQLASFHVRELLYIYLYTRVIFFYRIRFSPLMIAVIVFCTLTMLIALHTYHLYGMAVALHCVSRFIHVALLAPLAGLILVHDKDIKWMFSLWMGVVFAGILTVVYQLSGEKMDWLVQNYIAIRGDLLRHKSLLGEPNVGGMAAVLAYTLASLTVRNIIWRYTILLSTSFLVIVCLSKAALASFVIMNFVLIIVDFRRSRLEESVFPSKSLRWQIAVIALWYSFLALLPRTENYVSVAINSLIGRQVAVPGAVDDFADRFIFWKYGGNIASYLFGGSFGSAGSAALELKVPNAVGPHNMYLEVLLVGGAVFLVSLLLIQLLSVLSITKSSQLLRHAMLPVLFLIYLYMTGYPIIYEPITGSLFWLIVGVCARSQWKISVSEPETT